MTASVGTIDVNYYVSDLTDDYVAVYLKVRKTGETNFDKIFLSKTSTHYTIRNREPGTSYTITLCYDAYYTSGGIVDDEPTSKDVDTATVRTGTDLGSITITALKESSIEFQVSLDKEYPISSGEVVLCNAAGTPIGQSAFKLDSGNIGTAAKSYVSGSISFNSSGVNTGDRLYLKFQNVVYNGSAFEITKEASITYNK